MVFFQPIIVQHTYFIQIYSHAIADLKLPILHKNNDLCEYITCFFGST